MKTVTLEVATLKEVKRRAQDAFMGRKQGARISFATPELLFQLMTAKRWELLRTMTGAGPLAIREAARRVDRDVTRQNSSQEPTSRRIGAQPTNDCAAILASTFPTATAD